MTLAELARKIGANRNILRPYKDKNVPIDMTLNKAIKLDEEKHGRQN